MHPRGCQRRCAWRLSPWSPPQKPSPSSRHSSRHLVGAGRIERVSGKKDRRWDTDPRPLLCFSLRRLSLQPQRGVGATERLA